MTRAGLDSARQKRICDYELETVRLFRGQRQAAKSAREIAYMMDMFWGTSLIIAQISFVETTDVCAITY